MKFYCISRYNVQETFDSQKIPISILGSEAWYLYVDNSEMPVVTGVHDVDLCGKLP